MRLFSSLSAPPLSRCRFPFSPFPLALSLSLFPFHCSAAQVPRREKVGYLFCERARGTGQPLYFAAACKHSAAARVAACAAKIAALLRGYKKGGRLNGGRKNCCAGRAWSVVRSRGCYAARRTLRAAVAPLPCFLAPLPSRTPARGKRRSPLGRVQHKTAPKQKLITRPAVCQGTVVFCKQKLHLAHSRALDRQPTARRRRKQNRHLIH